MTPLLKTLTLASSAQVKKIAEMEAEVDRLRDLLIEDRHESWCRTNTADALHEDVSCNCHLSTLGGA
jgi:hypothetical protein